MTPFHPYGNRVPASLAWGLNGAPAGVGWEVQGVVGGGKMCVVGGGKMLTTRLTMETERLETVATLASGLLVLGLL